MLLGIDASRAAPAQRTGTEAYAFHLIRALIPLAAAQGHRLRLYFNQSPPDTLFPPDTLCPPAAHVETVVMPFPRLWTHLRLGWELARRPPDVFFTPAHVIPITYYGRSVATIHDLGYHHFPQAHTRSQLAYLRWSTRHNGRRARRILADSATTRSDLIRFDGVDPGRIAVVYPGIDPALAPVTEPGRLATVQQKYSVQAPYLLYLGTLQPRKNLTRLVEAYAASGVSHQLVLAGKQGWLAQPILNQIEAYRSANALRQASLTVPGFIDDEDKAALISGATALLFPSLYEGFGFPALEAQACGTAVLCAKTSSLPEIVGDGALLVDPLDTAGLAAAIRRLANEPQLRQQLVERGFVNVRRFSWKTAAEQALAVLVDAAAV